MKFNFACLLLISSASALHVDDLNSLNTCGERKQEDFPDREFLPPGFNSYSVKLKFSDITCSGSVIEKNTVLTAAHCCRDLSNMPTVYFGEFWKNGDSYYDSLRFKVNATNVIRHPEYGKYPTRFDACLVFLERTIYDAMSANCSRSGCVEPLCLFTESPVEAFINFTAIASGFGWKTWIESKTLDHYSGSILEERMCLLHENMQKKKLHSGNFCIGNLKTISQSGRLQVDSITLCDGFSGSPLVVNNGGYATLVGILSWGGRCGRYKKQYNPLVFQSVYEILPWIRSHLPEFEFKKITAPREIDGMSSTHPYTGPDPTKTPSILNTTLPGPQNLNTASITIVSSSSQTSTIYASSTSDMETATVTSRKHLDSGYIDKSSAGKIESTSGEEIDEIPSKEELTFTDVTSATESTTESVQSLPEASSVDIDLPSGVNHNVIQKLRQHETPIQANDESFSKESTRKFETSSFTKEPLVFIDGRNFEVSEAIEESLDRETNIEMIVDKANENKNENSQFDSSQMPGLSDSELSSSQGINLSSNRDPPANMNEIQLSNLDSAQVYGDNVQVPVVVPVDPHIALSRDEYAEYYTPWSSDKGAYESSFAEFSDPISDEFDNDWDFIQVPVDFDVKSNMDNEETDHLSEVPIVISVSREKSRTPIYYIPDYDISNSQEENPQEVVEPPMQWIPSKESSSIAPPTSTTKTTSTTTKTTAISKAPETKLTKTTSSTSTSKSTESSIPTSKTTATSTTVKTTASEIISTTTEIKTMTKNPPLATTTLPTSTTTTRETTLPTTLSATETPKKLTKITSTSTLSTTSTTTSTLSTTSTTTSTKTSPTISTTTSSSPSMSLTTTQTSTTTSFTITTTTKSSTTRSRTVKLIEIETTTKNPLLAKPTLMMPTTSTNISSSSPISKSKMNITGSLEPAPTLLSTTSVFNVAKENYKKTKLPVTYILSTIPPASRPAEITLSSSSITSSRKHQHKKHQKQHQDRKVSRKERKRRKQEEVEIATPKNAAALTKSPLSRDFSSQTASTSDAMHSTMPKIIVIDLYQEIIYDDEIDDGVSKNELPFVALFRNKAYLITCFVIIVLSVTLFGFFATRKQAFSDRSSSQILATKKESSQNSRSSYSINV